jgi:hypothetical protein
VGVSAVGAAGRRKESANARASFSILNFFRIRTDTRLSPVSTSHLPAFFETLGQARLSTNGRAIVPGIGGN